MPHRRESTARTGTAHALGLSHADALTLLEIIQECMRCEREETLRSVFLKLQDVLPFEHAVAVLGRYDGRRGVVVDHLVNVSCRDQFIKECVARDYLCRSALSREHFTRYDLKFWAEARRRLGQPPELVSLALDLGMRDGYTTGVPPRSWAPHGSMFCLSVRDARRDERAESLLELVVPHLHFALCRLVDGRQRSGNGISLTIREKDILRLMMQGKSSWDMSVIIGISESTVNYHVYNLMQKLEAINRPQAVAVAARLGLVEID